MNVKMNPEVKALWVQALESGEFKQGTGALRTTEILATTVDENGDMVVTERGGSSFCCLGVLCELHRKTVGDSEWENNSDAGADLYYQGETCMLPENVMEWAGLEDIAGAYVVSPGASHGRSLWELNDAGHSFNDLATLIKEQL